MRPRVAGPRPVAPVRCPARQPPSPRPSACPPSLPVLSPSLSSLPSPSRHGMKLGFESSLQVGGGVLCLVPSALLEETMPSIWQGYNVECGSDGGRQTTQSPDGGDWSPSGGPARSPRCLGKGCLCSASRHAGFSGEGTEHLLVQGAPPARTSLLQHTALSGARAAGSLTDHSPLTHTQPSWHPGGSVS